MPNEMAECIGILVLLLGLYLLFIAAVMYMLHRASTQNLNPTPSMMDHPDHFYEAGTRTGVCTCCGQERLLALERRYEGMKEVTHQYHTVCYQCMGVNPALYDPIVECPVCGHEDMNLACAHCSGP